MEIGISSALNAGSSSLGISTIKNYADFRLNASSDAVWLGHRPALQIGVAVADAPIMSFDRWTQAFVDSFAMAVTMGLDMNQYRFVPARLVMEEGEPVPIGPTMTLAEAVEHINGLPAGSRDGGIMALRSTDALSLANHLGGASTNKGSMLHGSIGSGFLFHLHPNNNPHAHIWFLF